MQVADPMQLEALERSASRKRTFYRWLLFMVLGLFAIYYLAPLYVMIITSLKSMEEIRQGNLMTLPGEIMFDAWKTAWSGRDYDAGNVFLRPFFWNSIKMVVPAVAISTFFGALNGYALTKWRFKGDNLVFLLFLFGCFIPYQAILLPMARTLGVLGISNSITGLVVVHSM